MTILAEIARVRQMSGPDYRVALVTGDDDLARRAGCVARLGATPLPPDRRAPAPPSPMTGEESRPVNPEAGPKVGPTQGARP